MEFNGCGRIFHSVSHSHPEAGVTLMVEKRLVSVGCLRRKPLSIKRNLLVQVWRQCLLSYSLKLLLFYDVESSQLLLESENKETKEKKTYRGTSFSVGYNVLHLRMSLICLTKWSFLLRISDWTHVVLHTAFQDWLGNTVGLIFYQLFSCWRSSSTLSLLFPTAHDSNFKLLFPTLDSLIIEGKIASWKSKSLAPEIAKPTHFWISAIQLSNKISFQVTAGIDFYVKCLQNVAQVN